ncbi:hypothetical protein BV898_01412 [Hypsibius exemplaris]|uniref:Gustatory receptor n=1 Tax=Hypsibius exemplaris TaxID=2072580 RepID=A0A1W0XBE0_HYPEX|nr:hypothetical protein BV898_01412 [Hypsibius exemplaris]
MLLKVFGFIPSHGTPCCLQMCAALNCMFHVVCGAVGFFLLSVSAISEIVQALTKHSHSIVIKLFSYAPFFALYGRAYIILLLFLFKRKIYAKICRKTRIIAEALFKDEIILAKHYTQWKKVALVLGAATAATHMMWEFISYLGNIFPPTQTVTRKENETETWFSSNTSSSQPLVPQPLFWFSIYFEVGLFCLSQQVVVMGVVFAITLRAFLTQLNKSIIKLTSFNQDCAISSKQWAANVKPSRQEMLKQLEQIRRHQAMIRLFCDDLNACFGFIMFVSHVLDQVCYMGYVASVVMQLDNPGTVLAWVFRILSLTLFSSYSGLLLMPLARAHETVRPLTLVH